MNKYFKIIFFIILIIFSLSSQIAAVEGLVGHNEDRVMEVYDEENNYIFSIAMGIAVGDRYISQNNTEYVIKEVRGDRAIAENRGKINLMAKSVDIITPLARDDKKLICLYHTHNGESYKPGSENKNGRGDIHTIGDQLANTLENNGVRVIHSHNLHLPHDGAAYTRSKATALSLAKNRPDAIFDLHRDAIPDSSEYTTRINGKLTPQIRVVVGRQNPDRKVNDQFARNLKAVVDKKYPGLIRDIFYGKGEYNQTIYPRSLLMEFGTFTNSRQSVERSASLMGNAITDLLYGGKGGQSVGQGAEQRSAFTTILWIIGVVSIGLFAYLYMKEGSIEGVRKRVKRYFSKEILDNFGNRGDKS